mmetsp:Transcript_20040/g.43119  ORF Transcript_20040/g.43119 Transcript_20040/m.43119 type:complete len:302 (-) Transcript_20040:38-943(-)
MTTTTVTTTNTTAVREALDSVTFSLASNIRAKDLPQHCVLPPSLLRFELPEQRDRILDLWAQLLSKMVHLTRNHRARFTGVQGMKDAVYTSSMENITNSFSRNTQNIKATFVAQVVVQPSSSSRKRRSNHNNNNNSKLELAFFLRVARLNDVSELVRTMGRTQTAEIPFIPEEVRAEAIGTTADNVSTINDPNNNTNTNNDTPTTAVAIPTATVEIVDEAPAQTTTILGDDNDDDHPITTVNTTSQNDHGQATPSIFMTSSIPVVSAVAIVDDSPVPQQQQQTPVATAQGLPRSSESWHLV